MRIGIIGTGAIGGYVRDALKSRGFAVRALLVLPELLEETAGEFPDFVCVSSVPDLPDDIDHMIDCAGHLALRIHGPGILRRGCDLTTVSVGGLADAALYSDLDRAAAEGNAKLYLVSGAIGALDCLRAAGAGNLRSVTYTGRKPPKSWKGSPAAEKLDLDRLAGDAQVHFEGTARAAATHYPANANVAAAVALAGIGFDETQVRLIADPNVDQNIHKVVATGDFGQFSFEIKGNAMPENPKSSALAAMSVVSRLEQETRRIRF
ncbi:MAG: aspartate dehydrogenase [Gammaproteobacteria bacterium]|nr:aspartate dehydrogenase [Gammaproteobacteria bacterium]